MNLEAAFKAYVELAQAIIASSKRTIAATGSIKRSTQDALNLRSLVEDLESQAEFQTFVRETAHSFSKEGDREKHDNAALKGSLWGWNVEAFFRRSGFYLSVYNEEAQDADALFRNYSEAFEKTKTLIRYLVPLEFVDFDGSSMDFGDFRIVQLLRDELESLLQSEINRVFFPYAYADQSQLAGLWFLEVIEESDAWEPGSGGPMELRGPEVGLAFTDFPPRVEYALKLLALYDWGTYQAPVPASEKRGHAKEHDIGWDRFHVPFIISMNENQIWNPQALPDLSVLSTQPDFSPEGEEIGETPVISIFVEADRFKPEMRRLADLMAETEEKLTTSWRFADVALGYLVKAFFASGLDQLLWHIVVVESLLGDKGDSADGLMKRLKRRAAFVVAQNEQERSNVKKLVDTLYTLRSDIVHGNTELVNSRVYLGHLREARELARGISIWFLESFSNLNREYSKRLIVGSTPTRKEILAAIDVLSDDVDADNVKFVLDVLSAGRTGQANKMGDT
jgi:hypothetical protein